MCEGSIVRYVSFDCWNICTVKKYMCLILESVSDSCFVKSFGIMWQINRGCGVRFSIIWWKQQSEELNCVKMAIKKLKCLSDTFSTTSCGVKKEIYCWMLWKEFLPCGNTFQTSILKIFELLNIYLTGRELSNFRLSRC